MCGIVKCADWGWLRNPRCQRNALNFVLEKLLINHIGKVNEGSQWRKSADPSLKVLADEISRGQSCTSYEVFEKKVI